MSGASVADDVYPGINTMAPQSALCICSRKWQAKLICFGAKTSKFCLRIISFSSLESELSFDLKDSEINFDRARSATQREITCACLELWEQFAIFQAKTGKTSLRTSCLYIYY